MGRCLCPGMGLLQLQPLRDPAIVGIGHQMHVQNGDLRIPQIDDRFIQRTMQIKIPGDRILVATIRQRNLGVRLDGISGKTTIPDSTRP